MSDYEVETSHRVYDNISGVCIEIRPDPDFPDSLLIYTPDKDSEDFYGEVRLTMSPEQAIAFHKALTLQLKAMEVEHGIS